MTQDDRTIKRINAIKRQIIFMYILFLTIVMGAAALIAWNQYNIMIMQTDTLNQLMELRTTEEPAVPEIVKEEPAVVYPLTQEERDLVEGVVAAEARGEDLQGQMAVAQVIRDRSAAWDMTITDIIRAPGQFADPYRGEISDETRLAVANVFDGGMNVMEAPTTHFHEVSITPYWTSGKTSRGKVGCHEFWY